MNMLKGVLQWPVYPQRTESTHIGASNSRFMRSMYAGTHFTNLERKAEWTLAGKVTQMLNPRRGRRLNLGPSGWEAEIL